MYYHNKKFFIKNLKFDKFYKKLISYFRMSLILQFPHHSFNINRTHTERSEMLILYLADRYFTFEGELL